MSASMEEVQSEAVEVDTNSLQGDQSKQPPEVATKQTAQTVASTSADDDADDDRYVSLILRDGLDFPIANLPVLLTLPSGEMLEALTTTQGAITVQLPATRSGDIKVAVKDVQGQVQDICKVDAARCQDAVIVRSPKVESKQASQPHTDPAKQSQGAKTGASPARSSAASPPVSAANAPTGASTPAASGGQASTPSSGTHWWSANGALSNAWDRLTGAGHIQSEFIMPPPPGALAALRNSAGLPIALAAGPECPNKENLRLGKNNIYREYILEASKRSGLTPHTLCAMIECEAAYKVETIPKLDAKGKPLKDKKGRPLVTKLKEVWNANSGNVGTNAAGLTQFLIATWLDNVLRPGFFIHDESIKAGWVCSENVPKKGKQFVFKLADGKTTQSPWAEKYRSDANIRACLAKRLDPRWSILAAADYGKSNYQVALSAGFKLGAIGDMEKAKVIYVMHHEGPGAGVLFIKNKLAPTDAAKAELRKKFAKQLDANLASGLKKADDLISDADGDVELAYRKWLSTYVNSKFSGVGKFYCSGLPEIGKLTAVLEKIGGEKIHEML